jgi:uncharacterized phage infection (PIP) family protein YhgE
MGMTAMNEDQSPDFKFAIDEDSPDSPLQEDRQDRRINRLSRRITLVAVILPCLIGAVLFFFYLDLKKRVISDRASGSLSVENLSRDVETRIQEQSTRLTELESALTERAGEVDKKIEGVKSRVSRSEARLKKLAAQKANADDLQTLSASVAPLAAGIDAAAQSAEAANTGLTQLAKALDGVNAEMIKLQADISALVVNKVDRKAFAQDLAKLQADMDRQLNSFSGDAEKKLAALRNDIRTLRAELKELSRVRTAPPPSAPPAAPNPGGAGSAPPAEPGKIIEKDLN